jgi:formiminoglutamase
MYFPGVSAPSVVGGLSEIEALELSYLAGKCKKVMLVDTSEFNPAVESTRSAKLLVNIFYSFCKGFAERLEN